MSDGYLSKKMQSQYKPTHVIFRAKWEMQRTNSTGDDKIQADLLNEVGDMELKQWL